MVTLKATGPKLEPVVEQASERGSHRSQSMGYDTPASDNEFMEIDNERDPAQALDQVKADNDDAAMRDDRQIGGPPDPAAASPSPDFTKDDEHSQSMSDKDEEDTEIAFFGS